MRTIFKATRKVGVDGQLVRWGVVLVILLSVGQLYGQRVAARLDLGRKEARPTHIEYVPADGGLVTFGNMSRKTSRYLGVTKYDAAFNREWTREVLVQNGRTNVELVSVLGGDIFVFISEYIPQKSIIQTSFTQLDLEGNVVANREVIDELPNKKEARVDLKFTRSINKKKLLCYRNLDNSNKREKLIYYLFDAEKDEIVNGEIEIPYPDDKFQVRRLTVSNSGLILLLGKVYLDYKANTPGEFGYSLYRYKPGETGSEMVDIELGDLFITDLVVKVDPKENIFLAGFFSHRSTNEIAGTVFYRLNDKLKLEVTSTQRFPEGFFEKFLSRRQVDRGKELSNFFLDNIVLRSDGGVLLVAEKYYTTFNSYVNMYGYWVDQRIYHYDEIIVSSVAANGDLEWSAVVDKQQSSEFRETLSYLNVVSGADLFLIYGDQPRRSPHTLYYREVSLDGKVGPREILLDKPSRNDSFYPRFSLQISNYEALLVYYKEKEKVYSVVKMEF